MALLAVSVPTASAAPVIGLNGAPQGVAEADWEAVSRSGASVVRFIFQVDLFEKEGAAAYDVAMAEAAKKNLKVVGLIFGRSTDTEENHSPYPAKKAFEPFPGEPHKGTWANFLEGIANRYGPGGAFWNTHTGHPIEVWEVWNEPNLGQNNPGGVANAKKYAEFLRFASARLKAAQPSAIRLFGGLTPAGGESVNLPFVTFLKDAAGGGTGAAFEGLSLHPYSFNSEIAGVEKAVTNARNVLDDEYSIGKRIWITELGWPAAPDAPAGGTFPAVSEAKQAENLAKSFNWIKGVSDKKKIDAILWFCYRDYKAPQEGGWAPHSGLLNSSGVPRPAWWAFQEQTGAPFWPVASNWFHDNLGGETTGDPDIASWGANRFDVFIRGTDNQLWQKYWNGSAWVGWYPLGGAVLTSGVGAVAWGANRIDVVGRTVDGSVNHWWWNGSGWAQDNLGGNVASDPTIASPEPGRLDVFAQGIENALWHRKWKEGEGWGGWERVGGPITSAPGAVSAGKNRLDVVARSGATSTGHWWWVRP